MTSRAYTIEITTQDLGHWPAETTGLSGAVQAVRAVVSYRGESRSHVVIAPASEPFVLESDDAALESLFPHDVVSAVRSETRGAATISCRAKSKRERWEAAAVIATLKRSWGWDESPFIRVMFADGREHLLNPVFDAGSWWVEDPLAGS